MGHGLKGLPRDQYVLATKVGRYDKAKFDFSAERVTASVHESLKRLQVDHIDLIQTHDIEFGDLDQVNTCPNHLGLLYELCAYCVDSNCFCFLQLICACCKHGFVVSSCK